ncbi:MAG TPA: DUF6285 domain-containing protein [Steroidobacteraceae bacterium]|jgi:hypothetical protein
MQDQPAPVEIIKAVAEFIRSVGRREMTPNVAYQARVAANALDLVGRELSLAPGEEVLELERLRAILGRDGTLAELNAAFTEALDRGVLSMSRAEIRDHLWQTTLAKLSVDQPSYSGYLAALKMRRADPQ